MKPLLLIAGFYAAINAATLAGIGFTVGWPPKEPITIFHPDDPSRPEEQMALRALLEITTFSEAVQPQFMVLGASGAAYGFPPSLMQASLPGFVPSTIATGGATVTEVRRLFDEIVWAAPPAVLRRSVLVLGMSYLMFCSDAHRYSGNLSTPTAWWQQPHITTHTQKAARRHPMILDNGNPVRRMLPRALVLAARRRLRIWGNLSDSLPLHVGEWFANRGLWRFQTMTIEKARRQEESLLTRSKPILEWYLGLSVKEQVEWHTEGLQKAGGIAALAHALAYLIPIAMAVTLIFPILDSDTAQYIEFVRDNQFLMHIWILIAYWGSAISLVIMAFALFERLKADS
ncbi:MAG: hypothetical protein HQ464_04720, partial [Planctomycetes bacterium]|nr:hypothetical protein [Planctomycetota bacterium]